jgi:hypothetical protein
MPKNRVLPFDWYESPNIHLISIRDFRMYCNTRGYPVRQELHFSIAGIPDRKLSGLSQIFLRNSDSSCLMVKISKHRNLKADRGHLSSDNRYRHETTLSTRAGPLL